MLSTSKSRKPQQPTPSGLDRRAFFPDSRRRVSTETRRYRSEASCMPDTEKPSSQTCPCGVRHDTCIRSETDLGRNATPMASSTRAFFPTPIPSRPNFIGASPTMPPPRFPGFGPPLRAPIGGFNAGSKVHLMREVEEEHAGSGVPWLQNFAIGVLVATSLAAVLTLALTADRPARTVVSGTSATPLQDGKMAESGGKLAAPVETMDIAAKIRYKGIRGTSVWINMTSALPLEATKIMHRRSHHRVKNKTESLRVQRHPRKLCGPRFYTYCVHSRREAYYSAQTHSCVLTPSDKASLCNRGANRFPNLGTCLASCARGAPLDRCFESTVFTDCSRQDVLEEWWFYDNTGCVQWNFPRGSCPSHGSGTFRSREDCTRNCAQHQRHHGEDGAASGTRQRSHCHAPIWASCSLRQMRFPYFADMTAKGSARCVRASRHTLRERRCLVGSNRFDSVSACKSVCGGRRKDRQTTVVGRE